MQWDTNGRGREIQANTFPSIGVDHNRSFFQRNVAKFTTISKDRLLTFDPDQYGVLCRRIQTEIISIYEETGGILKITPSLVDTL